MSMDSQKKEAKVPYILGGLAFIPLFGVGFGLIAMVWGILTGKKLAIMLGAGGILFTFLLYGSLFYFGMVANYGPYHEMKKQLTRQLLTQTRGQILIYKERNGSLPTDLDDIGHQSQENFSPISDPWMNKFQYTPHKDGSFELRSFGPDGAPGNSDDIVSEK